MPAFTTVLSIAAVAGALVQAAPIAERGAPKDYYVPYLEPYDGYHLRYLALDCQDKHNTTFFQECCRPMLSTQTLADRPDYCTPNATEIASASSYIASTSQFGTPTASVAAASATDNATPAAVTPASSSSSVDYESSAISVAEASYTSSSSAEVAPQTQAALAPVLTTTSSTSTWVAPTTTSSTQAAATTTQSSGGNNGGQQNTGGYATYFYQNGNPGACGNYNSDSTPLVAIDQAWWPNFGTKSDLCGRWVTVTNTNNGKSVAAVIADVCPTCANGNSLDLSVGAFTAIASEADGMVPISWSFN